jgi:hypothetical protein
MFYFMFSKSPNVFSFRSSFISGNKKSHTKQCWENVEVAARVGFCVWLRNVVHAETSVLVCCCAGFSNPMTTTFLVACNVLHHGYAAELVNNNLYLLWAALCVLLQTW